jgi:hypothetical protein
MRLTILSSVVPRVRWDTPAFRPGEMLKRGSRFYLQAVCNSLYHTHSQHTYTHTHTHTRGQAKCSKDGRMRSCRRHLLVQCFKRQGHGWLKASSGADSYAFLESSACIQAPDHTSRRCSKTSKCIRNIENRVKSRHVYCKHHGAWEQKSTWDME